MEKNNYEKSWDVVAPILFASIIGAIIYFSFPYINKLDREKHKDNLLKVQRVKGIVISKELEEFKLKYKNKKGHVWEIKNNYNIWSTPKVGDSVIVSFFQKNDLTAPIFKEIKVINEINTNKKIEENDTTRIGKGFRGYIR